MKARTLNGGCPGEIPVPGATLPYDTQRPGRKEVGGVEAEALGGEKGREVQAVFQHVKGVVSATSGYAGGTVASPDYEQVSTSTTGVPK